MRLENFNISIQMKIVSMCVCVHTFHNILLY